MKKWTWAAAVLVLLAVLAWAFAPRPVAVEAAVVARGPFEQAIEEEGRTRVRDRYIISAPVAGQLLRINLREGDPVQAGEAVALIRPALPPIIDERATREARARVAAAKAGVQRAELRTGRARLSEQDAARELQRQQRLADEGFVSTAALDAARLALQLAGRDLAVARAEQEQARQELAQAEAALAPVGAAGEAGASVAVRAPAPGVVLRMTQASEANVPAGAPLLEIGDPSRLEVVVDMLTTDAVQAVPGGPARIEGWGGPPLPARVRRVEPSAFTKVSALGVEEQRVRVLLDVPDPPPAWDRVGDGFRVTARVITRRASDVLLVPVGALFPLPEGGTGVFRIRAGRAQVQPVELGGRNAAEAWVRTGLSAGEQVILYPPAEVDPGTRVRVRTPSQAS